jgi:hypothetical protein
VLHRRMRQAPQGTAAPIPPNYAAARQLAGELAWAIEQVEERGRRLGPIDLHELAQETAGDILGVLRSDALQPSAAAPISLADAVDALRTVLELAEAGIPGAGQVATCLAETAYALVHLYGTAGIVLLDGRAVLPQRDQDMGVAHTLMAEARR